MALTTRVQRLLNYFKKKKREKLLTGSLVLIAGFFSLAPGALRLVNGMNSLSYSIITFNDYVSIIMFSLFLMLPSLAVFCAAYMIWEEHSLGWKTSIGICAAALLIAIASSASAYFALPIVFLSGLAAAMEILNGKKLRKKMKDSPITTENVVKLGLHLSAFIAIAIVASMLIFVVVLAGPFLSIHLFTQSSLNVYNIERICQGLPPTGSTGGVLSYVAGSLLAVIFCEFIAIPIGIAAAIYLAEYSAQGKVVNTIRFFIEILAGSPSIVIAIVGYTLFFIVLNWEWSLWSAAIALSFMALPWNIRVAEGAIRAVPRSYREASFALGASQWQTARLVMLYAAMPGIVTGVLLGIGVTLGETLVLLFNYSGISTVSLPPHWWEIFSFKQQLPSLTVLIDNIPGSLQVGFEGAQTLPGGNPTNKVFFTWSLAFAVSFVLIVIYLILCVGALLLRNYLNKRMKGS